MPLAENCVFIKELSTGDEFAKALSNRACREWGMDGKKKIVGTYPNLLMEYQFLFCLSFF